MPELPEVETIRRQLEPAIVGRVIESLRVQDERWTRPVAPREVERALAGRRIEAVERRGKYLLLRLDGDPTLAMPLRMTGNLVLAELGSDLAADLDQARATGGPRLYEAEPALRHLRASFELDDGTRLLFTDARRFGHAVVLDDDGLDDYFASRLGV